MDIRNVISLYVIHYRFFSIQKQATMPSEGDNSIPNCVVNCLSDIDRGLDDLRKRSLQKEIIYDVIKKWIFNFRA